jgi:hypothetical protein
MASNKLRFSRNWIVTGYVGSFTNFPLDTIDSTLWIDLSQWAMPIANGEQKGILLQFGLNNPILQLSYTTPSVGLAYYHINVRKDAVSASSMHSHHLHKQQHHQPYWLAKIKMVDGPTPLYPTCLQSPQLVSLFRKNSPLLCFSQRFKKCL